MMGMDLGPNALTVASHIVLVAIVLAFMVRLAWGLNGVSVVDAIQRFGFVPLLIICLCGLLIERLYYIVARFLRPSGLDLWQLHPAPEVLSLIVAVGLYVVQVPLITTGALSRGAAGRRVSTEVGLYAVIWVIVVGLFY